MIKGNRGRSGGLRFRSWSLFALALSMALCFTNRPANAADTPVYDNFGVGNSYDTSIGWTIANLSWLNFEQGDRFTPTGSGQLSSIEVAMGLVTGPNHFDLFLFDDAGGNPGSLLESWSVDNAMGPFGNANPPVLVASALSPMLTAGTPYWLIASAGSDTWAAWNWNNTGAVGPHVAGPTGGPLQPASDNTMGAFRVSIKPSAVPEPSSMALLIGGVGGCFAMMRRRRVAK